MKDPHVVSLTYRLEAPEGVTFNDPPPLRRERPGFVLRLAEGELTAEMKEHHAREESARAAVEPELRAWEIDAHLRLGRPALAFVFERARVIDRDPQPGPAHVTARGGLAVGISATFTVSYAAYPAPPDNFRASPDVQTMWFRYRMYPEGQEPLLSMAYACLTLLEGSTGATEGARRAVTRVYNIEQAVRDTLGDIVSGHGGPSEARKFGAGATGLPLSGAQRRWVEEVVRALIRRKGEHDFDPSDSRSRVTKTILSFSASGFCGSCGGARRFSSTASAVNGSTGST
jgi:hypothetical protein